MYDILLNILKFLYYVFSLYRMSIKEAIIIDDA